MSHHHRHSCLQLRQRQVSDLRNRPDMIRTPDFVPAPRVYCGHIVRCADMSPPPIKSLCNLHSDLWHQLIVSQDIGGSSLMAGVYCVLYREGRGRPVSSKDDSPMRNVAWGVIINPWHWSWHGRVDCGLESAGWSQSGPEIWIYSCGYCNHHQVGAEKRVANDGGLMWITLVLLNIMWVHNMEHNFIEYDIFQILANQNTRHMGSSLINGFSSSLTTSIWVFLRSWSVYKINICSNCY